MNLFDVLGGIFGGGIQRGDELTVCKAHPMAGKTVRATRVLDDGRICTDVGVVFRPHQIMRPVGKRTAPDAVFA